MREPLVCCHVTKPPRSGFGRHFRGRLSKLTTTAAADAAAVAAAAADAADAHGASGCCSHLLVIWERQEQAGPWGC